MLIVDKYKSNISENKQKTRKIIRFAQKKPINQRFHAEWQSFFVILCALKRLLHNELSMRSIPTVTKNLLIINVLAFAAMYVFRSQVDLNDILGLHFFLASDFRVYQLVTYMFMHASFEHIFFNMFALWMFGCVVERVWGPKKFLFY